MALAPIKVQLIGHDGIDGDHRRLVELIERIDVELADASYELCGELFELLHELAEVHFEREEAILDRLGWPGLEAHCLYHQDLLDQLRALKEMSARMVDKETLYRQFADMAGFVVHDLLDGDLAFKDFLAEHG